MACASGNQKETAVVVMLILELQSRLGSMSAGFKTTDSVNSHELGVTTLRGASPKAPVLTMPMAMVVNQRPRHGFIFTHTQKHGHTQTHTCRQKSHKRTPRTALSSLYQLAASQSHLQEVNCGVNLCKHYTLP